MASEQGPLAGMLWTAFGILAVHNIEELATMGRFLRTCGGWLPGPLRGAWPGRFLPAVAVVTVVALAAAAAGARGRKGSVRLAAAVALQIPLLGLNGLQHAFSAVVTGGYVPGLVSGVLLGVPFSVMLVRRAFRETLAQVGTTLIFALGWTAALGVLLLAFGLLPF